MFGRDAKHPKKRIRRHVEGTRGTRGQAVPNKVSRDLLYASIILQEFFL